MGIAQLITEIVDEAEKELMDKIAAKARPVLYSETKKTRQKIVSDWYSSAGADGTASMDAATEYHTSVQKGSKTMLLRSRSFVNLSYMPSTLNHDYFRRHQWANPAQYVLGLQAHQGFIGLPGEWCRHIAPPLNGVMESSPEWNVWADNVLSRLF